jgi:hypothetical protein
MLSAGWLNEHSLNRQTEKTDRQAGRQADLDGQVAMIYVRMLRVV